MRRAADHHGGRALGLRLAGRLRNREVGAGAEVPLAGAGEHDRAHVEVGVRVPEVLREPVAHVVGDRVALVGAVDREPEHAVLELGDELLLDVHAFGQRVERGHLRTTNASRATAPRGRTTNGLISSSRTSSARSSARRCTFMIVSTSASTSAGLRAAHAFEQLVALELVQRAPGFVGVERRHAERRVAEHLGEDPAGPDRDRPVRRARRATRRQHLDAAASPSRTRARLRCAPSCRRGAPWRAGRRRRRALPSADPTPTRTRPASLLCSRSGDETFITTGKPIALGGLHRGLRPTCTARRCSS